MIQAKVELSVGSVSARYKAECAKCGAIISVESNDPSDMMNLNDRLMKALRTHKCPLVTPSITQGIMP